MLTLGTRLIIPRKFSLELVDRAAFQTPAPVLITIMLYAVSNYAIYAVSNICNAVSIT